MDAIKYKKILLEVKELLVTVLGIGLLAQSIVYFCNGGNALFQAVKNISYAQALFMLTAYFCVIQRVRLFNWQTLAAALLYAPFAHKYRARYIGSPDLFNRDKVVVWVALFLIILVVDMIVYKKYTALEKFRKSSLVIFAMMTVAMIFFRCERNHPFMLVLAFLFYLIPMTPLRWRAVVNQFCYSWVVAFIVMINRSMTNNPEVAANGRWYGDFLNIGDFGQFLGCTLVVVVYKLYQIWKQQGWKSIEFWLWALFCGPLVWAIFRVSTITMYLGVLLLIFVCFVVVRKNTGVRKVLKRLLIALTIVAALGVVGILGLEYLAGTDKKYWWNVLKEGNTWMKPIAELIKRAHNVVGNTRTVFGADIFEPGTVMNALDWFSSGRVTLIKIFLETSTFTGQPAAGIQVGSYFAFSAHNTYAQMIYEYGYIGGGLFLVWLGSSVLTSAKIFISNPKTGNALPIMWVAMLLGLMMGESIWFYYPALAMTLPVLYPVMVDMEKK